MNLDLDQLLTGLPPWDLFLKIDGSTYRVREVSEFEIGRLRDVPHAEQPAALLGFLRGLFEGPAPDLDRFTASEGMALYGAVNGYLAERVRVATAAAEAAAGRVAAEQCRRHDVRKAGE